ncbi:MAG: DUF2723 domain-containing protein [Gemmatimonadota bacterium]|nr:DUF2723 domain-containing protein [Gemmatimonadota bacterium]
MSQVAQESAAAAAPRTAPEAAPPTERPPYGLAALAGVLVFALYVVTLAPTTFFWDTSEYIATAHILGIPHPPGNPLFLLLARTWELLLSPTGLATAVRINLFSAAMSAGAAAFWFLVVHRILGFFETGEWVRRIGAGAAVLVSATAYTVWSQSNVNEKVYTVTLLSTAFLSWLAFLWRDHVEAHRGTDSRRWHDDNVLVMMVFLLALSEANHRMAWLVAPPIFVLVYLVKPQVLLNWKLYAWSAVAAVVGLSVQLFLPIRSALNPVINEAAPTCPDGLGSAMKAILTFGRSGCAALASSLAREQYQKPPVTERLAPFGQQMANYFQYFDWQWARSLDGAVSYFGPARIPITLLFLGLGIFGAMEHYRRDRKSFAYVAVLFATLSVGLVYYMNFKYGFSQVDNPELTEVRERDYFFLISFSVWGLWAGLGITALWLRAVDYVRDRMEERRAALATSPVLLLAFLPLVLNWPYANRAGDYAARDWAYNVLQSVEPYGILFTNGDNDTFPLWYLQEVEGIRRDVTVMVATYLNTPWYAKQIRELTRPCARPEQWREDPTRIVCQRSFEPDKAPKLYGNPRKPTRSILPLPDAQIEGITNNPMMLGAEATFQAGPIRSVLPEGTFVEPAHQFALHMIDASLGDRPVYFAATTNLHRALRLDEYTLRQGLVYKLVTPEEAKRYVAMPQDQPYSPLFGAYFDVERNRRLLDDVYVYRDLMEKEHWTEPATRGIPTYYAYALIALAQAEAQLGNTQRAEQLARKAERWMDLSNR